MKPRKKKRNRKTKTTAARKITQLERATKTTGANFRGLLESAPDAILSTDKKGRIVLVNSQAEKMFGYDRDELLGKLVEILLPERLRDSHFGHRAHYVSDPRIRSMGTGLELHGQRKDGTEFPVEISLSPMGTDIDLVVTAIVRDITDRKRAEETIKVRAHQQLVVAELGQQALTGADLSLLMDEAVSRVAQALKVDYCKVLELLPDGKALLLRAGVGWKDGYVGRATVGTGADSQAGYTLLSAEPVIVDDLRTETRFRGPPLLHEHGVVSGMSVIIPGKDRPFGVLGAHTTKRQVFTVDDINFLQAIANVLAEAIERKRTEEEIRLLQSITQAVSESKDFHTALEVTLRKVCEVTSWIYGEIWIPKADGTSLECAPEWYGGTEGLENFREGSREFMFSPGVGLPGRVWVSKKPLWVRDVTLDSNFPRASIAREAGLISAMGIPILARDQVIAVMNYFVRQQREEDRHLIGLVSAIAAQLGLAFQRKLAQEQAERNLERIRALHEMDLAITSTLDLRTILDILLEKTDRLLPFVTATTVRLLNRETGALEPVACRNLDEEEWKVATAGATARGLGRMLPEKNTPVMVLNVQTDPRSLAPEFLRKYGFVSSLRVPLVAKEEVLGALTFFTKEEHQFTDEEVEFLTTLASQAAVAIHNAQLYEEMAKLAGDLVKSNRVKDEFLSVMSHELRTPLNVVMGYTGMIKDGILGDINPQQEEALGKVLHRANDQLTMISNVLYATVIETEKLEAERHEVDLGDFLGQLRTAYHGPINKNLTLTWDYPPDLPTIKTDSAKLKQILKNLIDNAIKFTEKGSVTISARIRHEATGIRQQEGHVTSASSLAPSDPHGSRLTPHAFVELKVADTGVGISKEHLPIIFERFRQADSSETRLFGGVGMGLYIVKKLTELLRGKVEVESEPGEGSAFTVTIPCN